MVKNIERFVVKAGLILVAFCGGSAYAATNQATDPGGGGVTLTSSNTITVTRSALSIGKEARDLNGSNLGASPTIASGTKFYFVLYLDNTTSVDLTDVRITDLVDTSGTGFTVDTASFQILNTVASPGIEMTAANDTAWATAGTGAGTWNGLTWNSLTAAQGDGDQLDWNVTVANRVTIGGTTNTLLNVAKSTQPSPATDPRRMAVRFKVTMN